MSDKSASSFPVRGSLQTVYLNSIVLLILLAAVSLAGILFPSRIYPDKDLTASFLPNDVVNLVLGLPMLLISLILTWKKKLVGLLCFPGALFYLAYVYATYLIGLPFDLLFIPYLMLVTLGIYTLIVLVSKLDMEVISGQVMGKVPLRTTGIILLVLALLLLLYQVYSMLQALIQTTDMDQVMIAQWIVDFVLATPAALILSLSMIRRGPLGYSLATALLFVLSALFLGLIPFLLIQAMLTGAAVNALDLGVISLSSLICVIPFILFIRGIRRI